MCNVIEIEAVEVRFGRHLPFLTRDQEQKLRQYNQLTLCFVILGIWSVKLLIYLFILALIRGAHHRSRWVVYGLIIMACIAHGSQTVV